MEIKLDCLPAYAKIIFQKLDDVTMMTYTLYLRIISDICKTGRKHFIYHNNAWTKDKKLVFPKFWFFHMQNIFMMPVKILGFDHQ